MTRCRLVLGLLTGLAAAAQAQTGNGPMPAPAAKYKVAIQKDVMVPMRDGVRLATDIYRPEGAGDRLPVILMRTPYNKATYGGATAPAAFFAGQGYTVVTQDVRGQYGSEGFYRVQLADARDGYDAIDWIVKQPWASGSVGTYGCSYLGEVQYLLSARRHPALKAMIPQAASGATGAAGDYYTNFGTYDGGALTLSSIYGWFGFAGHRVKAPASTTVGVSNLPKVDFAAMLKTLPTATLAERSGFPPSDFKDFVTHPPADPYWAPVGYLKDTDEFDTPALHVNSWLDVTPEQTLYVANLMQKNAATARGRDNQFVIMSPTTHCGSERAGNPTKVGDREFGDSRQPYFQIYLDWFDHWLKGVDNGVTKRPKFQYYVMGENRWRESPSWPVPGMRPVNYYLTPTGGLEPRLPARGSRSFVYDPANPLPSRGGTICCTGNPADQPGIFDQTDLETRPDLLVYSSPVLAKPVTMAGTVSATIYLGSDAKDTDLVAKLIDVDEQGRSWNVVSGIKRVRYRNGMATPGFMEPGQVYPVRVSLKATAYRFLPGHRIRLWITSSDFPMYDRNLNTGGDNVTETTSVKATNTVHYGPKQGSVLVLPVLPD